MSVFPIGILGGTFDPIHFGHLAIARQLREIFDLPSVRLIPTGQSAYRDSPSIPADERLELVRLALAQEEGLCVDDREMRREGFCYTIDTLSELQAIYPASILVWLIGSDSLLNLTHWRDWQTLLDAGHLVVATRPGFDSKHLAPELAHELLMRTTPASPNHIEKGKISFLPPLLLPFSSTEIRARLATGRPVNTMTPVADQLKDLQLYPKRYKEV